MLSESVSGFNIEYGVVGFPLRNMLYLVCSTTISYMIWYWVQVYFHPCSGAHACKGRAHGGGGAGAGHLADVARGHRLHPLCRQREQASANIHLKGQYRENVLLGLLEEELPMAPLGLLRKCLHPFVFHTSILTPILSPAMRESPVQLYEYVVCRLAWKRSQF